MRNAERQTEPSLVLFLFSILRSSFIVFLEKVGRNKQSVSGKEYASSSFRASSARPGIQGLHALTSAATSWIPAFAGMCMHLWRALDYENIHYTWTVSLRAQRSNPCLQNRDCFVACGSSQ
jgi:hypothetical protein